MWLDNPVVNGIIVGLAIFMFGWFSKTLADRSTLRKIIVTLANQFAWHGDRLIWIEIMGISYGHICLEAISYSYYKYLDMHDKKYDRLHYIDVMFDDLSQVSRHLNIPASQRTVESSNGIPTRNYQMAKNFAKVKSERYHKLLYKLVMDIPHRSNDWKLKMWAKMKGSPEWWDKGDNSYKIFKEIKRSYFEEAEGTGV